MVLCACRSARPAAVIARAGDRLACGKPGRLAGAVANGLVAINLAALETCLRAAEAVIGPRRSRSSACYLTAVVPTHRIGCASLGLGGVHANRIGDPAPPHALAAQLQHALQIRGLTLRVCHRSAHQCRFGLLRRWIADACGREITIR